MKNNGNLKAIIGDGRGHKSINPWDPDDTPEAWTSSQIPRAEAYKLVPILYAAWQLRCKAMADLPFAIYKDDDTEVDNSDDYQNKVGFLPDPYQTFWKAEGALAGYGSWYCFNERNASKTLNLRYWTPDSIVKIEYDLKKYVPTRFERQLEKTKEWYDAKDVLYCWLPDPAVELGPPTMWPLKSALMTAQSLDAVNKFIADYSSRGMTKMFLLAVKGNPPPQEKERIESWWNAFWNKVQVRWKVFNSEAITPTVIGDGLEALRGTEVTRGLQEQVLAAMGVPSSLILADSANYATAQQDVRTFYTNTIVPDARIIQSSLNTQIFEPMGMHIEFDAERLEAFQKDESDRSVSLSTLAGTLSQSDPNALELSMSLLGYELNPEQEKLFEALKKQKEEDKEKADERMDEQFENPRPGKPTMPNEEEKEELNRFQRKALKKIGSDVSFQSEIIPEDRMAAIHSLLPVCKTEADVKAVFNATPANVTITPPVVVHEPSDIDNLADALREASKALVVPQVVTPAPQFAPYTRSDDMLTVKADNVTISNPDAVKVIEQFTSALDKFNITVNVPEQQPPSVLVNIPEQQAPVVNVAAPVINVDVPAQAAPVVNVTVPERKPRKVVIRRDNLGLIEGLEETK